ncbi:BTAD domain-containing putative transcriptional regulator [Streptomyces sp. NPDC020747]|uniref:AfsR/SARP family transcriptional regulator n=1 Tax=Streptomyces sp. NPDC020747 TaxID=3365086 RepID=UPI00378F8390
MRFRLLGPLEIQAGDRQIHIAADKQRAVTAALLAAAGQVVAAPSLTNEIWGDRIPASALPNLRTYVMRLRRSDQALGERLMTSPSGYRPRVRPDELDVRTFEKATESGCKALAEGDASTAASAFDHALAQRRGRPPENVPLGPALNDLAHALGEQYARTVEDHAEAGLALGDHRGVTDRLRPFVEHHPLRERAYGQPMLAPYRGGDVQGAVRVFRQARGALRQELGVDPGHELFQLFQAVLARDPELDSPTSSPGPCIPMGRPIPRQLPPRPTIFVGRTAELDRMVSTLRADAGPVVVATHGPGGIGKSALGLRAAYGVADHHRDGQLYVDPQGATSALPPLSPGDVLGRFLRAAQQITLGELGHTEAVEALTLQAGKAGPRKTQGQPTRPCGRANDTHWPCGSRAHGSQPGPNSHSPGYGSGWSGDSRRNDPRATSTFAHASRPATRHCPKQRPEHSDSPATRTPPRRTSDSSRHCWTVTPSTRGNHSCDRGMFPRRLTR